MSSRRHKMFYAVLTSVYLLHSVSQAQWGYGLASGMQQCNTPYRVSAGAQSYVDEYRQLKSQMTAIQAEVSAKKREKRLAEIELTRMKFAIERTLNSDAAEFIVTHAEEQRRCSDYEGMPKGVYRAPRATTNRSADYTYETNSSDQSSTQVRGRSDGGGRDESLTQLRREMGAGSTRSGQSENSETAVRQSGQNQNRNSGSQTVGDLRRAESSRQSSGGGASSETAARRSSDGGTSSETAARPSSGGLSGPLVGAPQGTEVRRSGPAPSTVPAVVPADSRRQLNTRGDSRSSGAGSSEEGVTGRRPESRTPQSVVVRGPSSTRDEDDADADEKYEIPFEMEVSDFSRLCPPGRRDLNGSLICADSRFQIGAIKTNKSECSNAVSNYAKKYAEVQALENYVTTNQEILTTYSRQLNEVSVAFNQETEGKACLDCLVNSSGYEQAESAPAKGQWIADIGVGLISLARDYKIEKSRQDYNASIGAASEWAPSTMSYGFPFLYSGISGALGAGGGQGGFGCASTVSGGGNFNGAAGVLGAFGNASGLGPYANNSMWGQPAWANAGAAVGGSMYRPGYTPWGANGPWGLNNNGFGVYPQMGGNFGGQFGFANPTGGFNGIPGSGINGPYMPGQFGPGGQFGAGGQFGPGGPFGPGGQLSGSVFGGANPFGTTNPFNTGGNFPGGPMGAGAWGGQQFGMQNPQLYQNQINSYILQQQQNLKAYTDAIEAQKVQLQAEQQRAVALAGLNQEIEALNSRYRAVFGSGGGNSIFGQGSGSAPYFGANGSLGLTFGAGAQFGAGGQFGNSYLQNPIGAPVNSGTGSGGSNR
jgi:hypothetical protein